MIITGTGFKAAATVAFAVLFALSVAQGTSARRSRHKKNPKSVGLLTGCTVNSSNVPSCTIPSGWTLVDAQGFESGAFSSMESTGFAGNPEAIDQTQAHTGSHALDVTITGSFKFQGLKIAGTSINSREIYLSYWQYVTNSNPGYGQSFNNWPIMMRNPPNAMEQLFEDHVVYVGSPCLAACTQYEAVLFGQGVPGGPNPFGGYGQVYSYTPGVWQQREIHLKSNDPSIYNGDLEDYFNGVPENTCNAGNNCPHNSGYPAGDFNGSEDASQFDLYIGGDWGNDTMWQDQAHTICATTTTNDLYNTSGPGTGVPCTQCPNQCPPNGTIPTFHIYYDDIIVLKK